MSKQQSSKLEADLGDLFDIKHARIARDKRQNEDALAAQKDIKMLIMMFSDGIPNIKLPLGDNQILEWDFSGKRLLFHDGEQVQFLDAAHKDVLIKVRPHLRDLVKKAQDFYRD